MTRAIERTLVAHGKIPPEEARSTARMVLGYFGPGDSVLDNKLTTEDRDRFYRLEEEGLLTSEEEDATVARGKSWRIHYWLLKKAKVREAGQQGGEAGGADDGEVYRQMDARLWNRQRPAAPGSGRAPP